MHHEHSHPIYPQIGQRGTEKPCRERLLSS